MSELAGGRSQGFGGQPGRAAFFFLRDGAQSCGFHLSRLQWAAQDVERPQPHGVQVFFPLAGAKQQDKAGRVLPEAAGKQEFAIGAVREILVAENKVHRLAGENLPGLADGEARGDSGGGSIQNPDQGTQMVWPFGNDQDIQRQNVQGV